MNAAVAVRFDHVTKTFRSAEGTLRALEHAAWESADLPVMAVEYGRRLVHAQSMRLTHPQMGAAVDLRDKPGLARIGAAYERASRGVEVRRIDYYDGAGRRIESRLSAPTRLAPFATLEIFIPKSDVRGGTGANFVVGWAGEGAIAEPVIEAVMIGDFANQSYSFVSTGRRIELVRP